MELNEALDNGRIHLASRIAFPPMATQSSRIGVPGLRMTRHYQTVAENPLVGLIITEHSYIDQQGKADPQQVSFASDEVIEPQKTMVEKLHRTNPRVKILAQISHAGAATSRSITDEQLVSASNIQMGGGAARALSKDEIREVEQKFAAAARRVQEAGYDGVEVHAAHGYLLNEFYSPLTNYRSDEYGPQSIENRTRFLVETLRAVREAVGSEFAVAVRFGGADYLQGGSTVADAAEAAPLIEAAGADLIDVSGGMNGYARRDSRQPGWFSDTSSAIKERISIPVLLTGGITLPEQARKLLDAGKADIIGIGRAMFRNPLWGTDS